MKHRDYISGLINHPLSQINEDEISYIAQDKNGDSFLLRVDPDNLSEPLIKENILIEKI